MKVGFFFALVVLVAGCMSSAFDAGNMIAESMEEETTSTIAAQTTTSNAVPATAITSSTTVTSTTSSTTMTVKTDDVRESATSTTVKTSTSTTTTSTIREREDDSPSSSTDASQVVNIKVGDCSDSDNGLDTNTRGTVTDGASSFEDSCAGQKIREQYCSDGYRKELEIICAHGCRDGRCMDSSSPSSNTQAM